MKQVWKHGGLWLAGICLCVGCTAPRSETTARMAGEPDSETGWSDTSDIGLPLDAVDASTGAGLSIGIDRKGKIILNNREIRSERLVRTLEKSGVPKNVSIRIEAHPNTPFETVVDAVRSLRNAGYTRATVDIVE